MRVLSAMQRAAKIEELLARLPTFILELIARQPVLRTMQIMAQVEEWLPADIPSATSREWVGASLEWLEDHGDLQTERGHWLCLPPYAIAWMDSDLIRLSLLGHVLADLVFESPEIACRIEVKPRRFIHDETLSVSDWGKPPIGVEREIIALQGDWEDLKQILISRGLVVIELSQWTRQLPNLDNLLAPAASQVDEIPLKPGGHWEYYEPKSGRADRWEAVDGDWRLTHHQLIRWCWEEARSGLWTTAYYWHAGDRQGIEISGDYLRLWQLRLDREARRPRLLTWRSSKLHVPRLIPASVHTWLRLLTSDAPQAVGAFISYSIQSEHLSLVQDVLREKLGLVVSVE